MNAPLVRDHADSAVLISGGTSGIGLASALALTDAGVRRVALLGRNRDRGEAARNTVALHCPEAQVEFIPTDARSVEQVEAAVAQVISTLGGLDIVISSTASAYRPELLHKMSPADLEGTLGAMAVPPMLLTRTALPHLREQGGGTIINIASDAAKVPTPGESALGAAMAAIVMFSRTAAMEAKRDGVRINAVTPSLVMNTETAAHVLRDGFSKKIFEKAATQAHLGVAEPEDLAGLIVFLTSPAAAKLTGQAISLNGGISAG